MISKKDWQSARIKDIGKVITGRTPPTEVKSYFGDEYPFITPSDMKGDKTIFLAERGISSQGASLLKNNCLPPKSITVSCIGWQMGKVAMTARDSFTNQQINTIVPNSTVEPDFIFYSLSTRREDLKNLASVGTRTPILIKSTFENIQIELPPLPTQHKIAAILSAYDDLIENNTRRITILEEMAQSLYREWFVHFRFPGHEKKCMVESALGMIPEGWEVVKSSDAIEIDPPTKVLKDGEKPFVSMAGLSTASMLIETMEMRTGNSGSKFKNGDTLFARITPCLENGKIGFVQFLPSAQAVAFGSTEFIVLRSKALCPEYVYLTARSNEFRDNAIKSMSGASGRQRVQIACFDKFLIAHPDNKTLTAFSQQVEPIFRNIYVLAKKNINLRRTRDLLLPKLISGEVDVEGLEIAGIAEG